MEHYLLVESRSLLDGGCYAFDLGKELRAIPRRVTIYLVQDGVYAAAGRGEAAQRLLDSARADGIAILADEASLRSRGIAAHDVSDRARISTMDELVDLVAAQADKAIWH